MNTATNQIVGQTYDSNGNQLSSSGGTLAYDAENRVLTAPGLEYGYDSRNKRVWRGTLSGGVLTQTVYAYGNDGQLLGTYSFVQNVYQYADNNPTLSVYFAGKRIGISAPGQGTAGFVQDRLGSSGKYYPYGEARGTVPQDAVGFATYTNDSATGLEYADQRYYATNFGRFMSPDRYRAGHRKYSVRPGNPTSWNRYAYVLDDPINLADPRGRDDCDIDGGECGPDAPIFNGDDGGVSDDTGDDDPPAPPDDGCTEDGCPDSPLAPVQQPPSTPPPCNTDVPKITTTLYNLASDILGITAQKDAAITPADLLALGATLGSDAQSELGSPTSFFQGGHFFLDLSLSSVASDFGGASTAAYTDFIALFDPSGNGRRYPTAVPTTDPNHSYYLHDHSTNGNQDLAFHFDRYNPYHGFPVGILQHFGVDYLYGSLGVHCLDPAWRN